MLGHKREMAIKSDTRPDKADSQNHLRRTCFESFTLRWWATDTELFLALQDWSADLQASYDHRTDE